jgi:hypothetical protein
LVDEINKYKIAIGKIPGEKFPDNFILQDMVDLNEGKRTVPRGEEASPAPEKSEKKPEQPADSKKKDA